MWCFVTHSDSVVCEFELPERARGEELLAAVCKKLVIIETDYFGLQFVGPKGENLWLNTRNKICRQVSGGQPFRFQFRVKFFVQPHLLLQETTRHQFFLHLKRNVEERRISPEADRIPRIYALMAQATLGDFDESHMYNNLDNRQHSTEGESETDVWNSADLRNEVALEHRRLRSMKASTSEYYFIQEISEVESYGIEFHSVKTPAGVALHVGVGSEELKTYDLSFNFVERTSYNVLKMATHVGKALFLTVATLDGENVVEFRLPTQESACALYRSITEHHAFFHCETVRNAVKSQFTRDFRETVISFFGDEESERKYIFDVKRTSKEVYDHCRRTLYQQGCDPIQRMQCEILQQGNPYTTSCSANSPLTEVNKLQQQLARMQDAFCCRICMDKQINAVFIPCGHMVACNECAENVQQCPICRGEIEHLQLVFLPLPSTS